MIMIRNGCNDDACNNSNNTNINRALPTGGGNNRHPLANKNQHQNPNRHLKVNSNQNQNNNPSNSKNITQNQSRPPAELSVFQNKQPANKIPNKTLNNNTKNPQNTAKVTSSTPVSANYPGATAKGKYENTDFLKKNNNNFF